MPDTVQANWVKAADLADFEGRDRKLVKIDGKQIAVFLQDGGVVACDNRCPHEGFPLSEGSLTDGCILTCNWHNWKFDLSSGETLIGGDAVRVYGARIECEEVLLDISDPPPEVVIEAALEGLHACFDRHEYDRMAREIARMEHVGGDPLDALRHTIRWTHDRFEFGTGHAVAAAADWLAMRDAFGADRALALTALTEAVGHFAWDSRREPEYPYSTWGREFIADDFAAAVEAENERDAVMMVKGGLTVGMGWQDFEPHLARAAMAHYQDFGHSLIYVYKTGQLIERLGADSVLEPLLFMIVRSIVTASREDMIPEFKAYGPALAGWDGKGAEPPAPTDLRKGTVAHMLTAISAGSGDVETTFDRVVEAACWQFQHYDLAYQDHTDKSVSQNVGWLSYTHPLTFGNALRKMAGRYPELWAPGLLQLGCFLGRNAGFVDADLDVGKFTVSDAAAFLAERKAELFDHGNPEFIVSCHLLKTITAVEEEITERPQAAWAGAAATALNRFLNSPLKRKHALRTAKQAISMIDGK